MAVGSRVTVGTSATAVLTAGAYGSDDVLIRNQEATASIYLGGSGVTTGTGYELKAGESLSFNLYNGESLYAIVASGTGRLDVLQIREKE